MGAALYGRAGAEGPPSIVITIKGHRFTPSEIHVPAGQDVELDIRNEDPLAEEFALGALGLEEVIAGNESGLVRLQEIKKGRYPFVGEYHSGTAKGIVVAE